MHNRLSVIKRPIVFLCTMLLLLFCATTWAGSKLQKLKHTTFTFELPDLDGKIVSNNNERFENKVILFEIWGTWCPPCREMTPVLKELHAKYASEGLVVVGAAFEHSSDDGSDPRELVAKYVSENDIRYLTLYGGDAEYASSLIFDKFPFREFDGFPTVVIIGRDGKAVRVEENFNEGTAGRLEAAIRELLASN